jgi:hypothetical protein
VIIPKEDKGSLEVRSELYLVTEVPLALKRDLLGRLICLDLYLGFHFVDSWETLNLCKRLVGFLVQV